MENHNYQTRYSGQSLEKFNENSRADANIETGTIVDGVDDRSLADVNEAKKEISLSLNQIANNLSKIVDQNDKIEKYLCKIINQNNNIEKRLYEMPQLFDDYKRKVQEKLARQQEELARQQQKVQEELARQQRKVQEELTRQNDKNVLIKTGIVILVIIIIYFTLF